MKLSSQFELVQIHEAGEYAEVVIRDKNNFKVYAGNIKLSEIPRTYYPPEYFKEQ